MNHEPQTLFDKVWQRHVVAQGPDGRVLLYIDRHLLHDGSFQAFEQLRVAGRGVRRPAQVVGTADHYVPTATTSLAQIEPTARARIEALSRNAQAHGILAFGPGDVRRGIAHVVGPEQGITQPGMTLVCGDSHTSTHGAMGAIAFGVGASEVAHVLATQTLWQKRPKQTRITVGGRLGHGVSAKDLILAIIARVGANGGSGHMFEYAGPAVRALDMAGRMTMCNMTIEAGARCGMVAPDDTTFQWLAGRPFAPTGATWDEAVRFWRSLPTDDDASFDREVTLDADAVAPMVTWGTSPQDALPIDAVVPDPAAADNAERRATMERALEYMGLQPGTALASVKVDRVFIGSCTNSRLEDLRAAAAVVRGRRTRVPAFVSPGSGLVKAAAEAEGLDRVFRDAGFEWRESGCSMCVGMNGDLGAPHERVASTSNRNFEGRQGQDVRTHLLSPAMAAAAAVTGQLTDVRRLLS